MSDSQAKYQQMLIDLRSDFRPQRDWGEGRGLLLVVGHFFVGVAAGGWLMSLIFASSNGLLLSYLLAALGGVVHLGFLGHPERYWRMMRRVKTSWVSRGFVGITFFLVGGVLYQVPVLWPTGLWGGGSITAMLGYGMAAIGMVVMIGYMGFVYTASRAIPFWNSPLHPALYVGYALRGGVAALLVTRALEANLDQVNQLLVLWIAVTVAVTLFYVLEIHGALSSGNAAARRSVHELLAGRVSAYFYGGILLLGIILPAFLVWTGMSGPLTLGAMALLGVASAGGDFFMKYATIRAGVHLPLLTRAGAR